MLFEHKHEMTIRHSHALRMDQQLLCRSKRVSNRRQIILIDAAAVDVFKQPADDNFVFSISQQQQFSPAPPNANCSSKRSTANSRQRYTDTHLIIVKNKSTKTKASRKRNFAAAVAASSQHRCYRDNYYHPRQQ
ncbi:hypothetical protein CVS40_9076 [Lucilia cuprina]|nr:hypothetical protein CVS40_9076 [Lucilia cuprina]